jgi:hypothetical protein
MSGLTLLTVVFVRVAPRWGIPHRPLSLLPAARTASMLLTDYICPSLQQPLSLVRVGCLPKGQTLRCCRAGHTSSTLGLDRRESEEVQVSKKRERGAIQTNNLLNEGNPSPTQEKQSSLLVHFLRVFRDLSPIRSIRAIDTGTLCLKMTPPPWTSSCSASPMSPPAGDVYDLPPANDPSVWRMIIQRSHEVVTLRGGVVC